MLPLDWWTMESLQRASGRSPLKRKNPEAARKISFRELEDDCSHRSESLDLSKTLDAEERFLNVLTERA